MSHNRQPTLLSTLERLSEEDLPIIVVDKGSTDGTAEAVRPRFPAVEVVCSERNQGAAGRDLGVALASTP